jgi:hypothetical protein
MNETIGKPIKIILKTNIPNNHIIEFSKDNLYKPLVKDTTGLSQYPFFTKAYKYNYSAIKTLTYNGAVKFFFNQKTFEQQVIASYGGRSTDKDIEIHNINVMLSVLFKFNKSKINASFNMLNNKIEENDDKSTEIPTFTMDNAVKTLNSMFQSNANNVNTGDDVYITVNNEIYKPEKIVYINDGINNPYYQKLLKGYIEFNKWLNSTDETDFIQIMYQYTFKQIEDKNQEYNDIIRQIQILEKTLLENVGNIKDQQLKDTQLREKLGPLEERQAILKKFIDIRKRSEYTQFYNLINEYKMDNNTELKIHIKKMLEGKENTLFKFLDNIINNKTSFQTYVIGEKDKIQTIYVLIDFIKGDNEQKKMDTTNINCSNQSEHLGKLLEDLMKGMKTSEKDNEHIDTKILKNKEYIFSMKDNRQIKVNYRDDFYIDNYHINTPILKNIEINKDELIDDINVRLLNKLLANNEELVKEYKFNNLDKVKSYISDILDEIKSSNKNIYDMYINCLNGKYQEAYKFYEKIKPQLGTFDSNNGQKIDVPTNIYFGYAQYNGDVSTLFDLIVKIIKQHNIIEEAKTQKTRLLNDIKKLNKTGGKRRSHKRRHKRRKTKKNV